MSDETPGIGHNSETAADKELARRIDRRCELLDQAAELQEELKQLKQQDKSDGYTEKVIAQLVKEKRGGPEYQENILGFELELDAGRRALGMARTLHDAQKLTAKAAETVPAPRRQRGEDGDHAR